MDESCVFGSTSGLHSLMPCQDLSFGFGAKLLDTIVHFRYNKPNKD